MRRWLAFLFLGLVGASAYLLTRPDPEDDGWSDISDRDWWDL